MPSENIIQRIRSWTPISDRVIVLPDAQQKLTESGVVTSSTKQGEDRLPTGTVLAVGPGRSSENNEIIAMTSYPDDRVLIGKHSGNAYVVDEEGHIKRYDGFVREEEVLICVMRQDSIDTTLS